MPRGGNLGDWIQAFDYGRLLPGIARMPMCPGENLARLRGLVQAIADYDWRSRALGQKYVRTRTHQAMKSLLPGASRFDLALATVGRFIHNSREEWQACLFGRPSVMSEIAGRSHAEGLNGLLENQGRKRGLVLVTAHYDSFCMGIALLGVYGLTISAVSSNVVESPRVHPAVREFFRKKYRNMEHYTRGGRVVHYEENMRFFYHALERGEAVVILGDIPGRSKAIPISFLDRPFRMPLGAWQLARRTGSAISVFICVRQERGTYRIVCLPPKEVSADNPMETMLPLYAFLEEWIRQAPERWIAADLLPSYEAS